MVLSQKSGHAVNGGSMKSLAKNLLQDKVCNNCWHRDHSMKFIIDNAAAPFRVEKEDLHCMLTGKILPGERSCEHWEREKR